MTSTPATTPLAALLGAWLRVSGTSVDTNDAIGGCELVGILFWDPALKVRESV
jgi:hypothetical protein